MQAELTASMPLRTTLPNNCSIILDNKQPQTCRSNLRRVRMLNNRDSLKAASRKEQELTLGLSPSPLIGLHPKTSPRELIDRFE